MHTWRHVMVMLGGMVLGWGLLVHSALAQEPETPPTLVEQAQDAYEELEYAEAEQYAQQVLQNYQDYDVEQLVQVHTLLGLIKASQNQQIDARRHFDAALSLDPQLSLDPLLVSPKILNLFEGVKQNLQGLQQPEDDERDLAVRYLVLEDPRPAAALRSMVVPGWGQFYKGEPTKGWLLVGLWTVTSTATAVAHFQRQEAKDAYESARLPGVVDERYDTYAAWHKVRNNLLVAAAGVWLVSYLDATLRWQRPREERRQPRLQLTAPAHGPGLQFNVHF